MGIENGGVYLHEVSGNMARELLGCISYTIIEVGSGSSLNKVVNIMDLLSLIFYFVPSPRTPSNCTRARKGVFRACRKYITPCILALT